MEFKKRATLAFKDFSSIVKEGRSKEKEIKSQISESKKKSGDFDVNINKDKRVLEVTRKGDTVCEIPYRLEGKNRHLLVSAKRIKVDLPFYMGGNHYFDLNLSIKLGTYVDTKKFMFHYLDINVELDNIKGTFSALIKAELEKFKSHIEPMVTEMLKSKFGRDVNWDIKMTL